MKLLEAVPNLKDRTVYMSWTGFPETTSGFYVYKCLKDNPSDMIQDVPETAEQIGSTTNAFFTDFRYFDSSILRRDVVYLIRAIDNKGQVCDTLNIEPLKSKSTLIQQRINAANYKAQLFFRNYNWAEDAYILRYKKTGKKCKCFDLDFGKSKNLSCPHCYGGGYVGGFYTPLPTKILPYSHNRSNKQIVSTIPTAGDSRLLRIPRYPGVYEGDFLFVDQMGILALTGADFKTIGATPTPTIMVNAVGLGKDHPAHTFSFDSFETTVDKVEGFSDGTVKITGNNLIPVIGVVRLDLYPQQDFGSNYTAGIMHIIKNTSSEMAFSVPDLKNRHTDLRYKLHMNNTFYEGRCFYA